ncbi:MAG: DinB family protein [Candidatus Thorarchaeota archaeon]
MIPLDFLQWTDYKRKYAIYKTIEMSILSQSILNQFLKALEMTHDAIKNVPDSKWHERYGKWFFSLNAYHNVETIAFYIRNDPKGMKWGERAGFSWDDVKEIENDILPKINKDLVVEYIEDMKEALSTLLQDPADDFLLGNDSFRGFSCVLEKLQYALRHTAQHCGELSLALRSWGAPHTKWK